MCIIILLVSLSATQSKVGTFWSITLQCHKTLLTFQLQSVLCDTSRSAGTGEGKGDREGEGEGEGENKYWICLYGIFVAAFLHVVKYFHVCVVTPFALSSLFSHPHPSPLLYSCCSLHYTVETKRCLRRTSVFLLPSFCFGHHFCVGGTKHS